MSSKRDWIIYGTGTIVGLIIGYAVTPEPNQSESCAVYKVDKKPVVSYALMPPPPIIRPAACPVAPKCEATKEEVFVSNAEASNDSDVKPKHHRRHRRWRR